MRLLRFSWWHH